MARLTSLAMLPALSFAPRLSSPKLPITEASLRVHTAILADPAIYPATPAGDGDGS